MDYNTYNLALGTLTFLAQMSIVILAVSLWLSRKQKPNNLLKLIGPNAILLAFLISLFATVGSLFYSDVIGFEPCRLCWYQRIVMYPQVVILGMALAFKDAKVWIYSLPLAVIGALIAIFHYFQQFNPDAGFSCNTIGQAVSCSKQFVRQFDYITIPMMALTGFVFIIVLMLIQKRFNRAN